jgi:hypothetical protein
MDEKMKRDEIIDLFVAGKITGDEALRELIIAGRTEAQARYEMQSLESVDVMRSPIGDHSPQ